ncbi:MAG: UDP-N-acetylmuramoyl-L-alanine--D-glutamate ligase [Deltaproteobacteria bacterium]|nr:UDP-N-acetylmuramoyl-L-alanine--D-glutamate ligase [Deltaproteobacteria bacterium]MBW2536903.1 UDP-N-acetylmuramoyl-L-alanine--D-glutamate ligase [Deltaproteobacteria bacterium]
MVIVGLGQSGVAAARLCHRRGAEVVAADRAPRAELSAAARALGDDGIVVAAGSDGATALRAADLVIVSPGVPSYDALVAAEGRGVEVVSELELASRFLDAPLVLVGGTNGKSTVTALVGEMLTRGGVRVFVGGNFGTPLCEAVAKPYDVIVVEISSFQAERVPSLRARVGVLLNVSEDHLDRYASFQDYADAKGNPFANSTDEDCAVIPAGDAVCAAQARRGAARQVTFSGERAADVAVEVDAIVDSLRQQRYPLAAIRLEGRHNVANACAAIAAAAEMGAEPSGIAAALAEFSGLHHRTELIGRYEGVRYFNDSKGTNVGATVAALRGLREPRAVLIAGGRDKLGAYEPLVEALRERGRALVVIGEAAERIARAAEGVLPIERASTMTEAVDVAAALAQPGDAVLLSPACSSFDMFESYQDRGEKFAAAVRAKWEDAE